MTFDELVSILKDQTRTDYLKAADIHAALTRATTPPALNIKPPGQRKKRAQKAPGIQGGIPGERPKGGPLSPIDNGGGFEAPETQQ